MADLGSLDFLRCGTRQFLRKLSGNPPRGSAHRSQSVPQSVKSRIPADSLSHLRQDIEQKTEQLNDSTFEVTEAWLFEFAGQHAEYMEKATSRAGSHHEFRSTTELFQHVLQHPRVQRLIGGWPSEAVPVVKPKVSTTGKDAQTAWSPSWSPGSTDTPGSADRLLEYIFESPGKDSPGNHDEAGGRPSPPAVVTNAFGYSVGDANTAADKTAPHPEEPAKPAAPQAMPAAPQAMPAVLDVARSKVTRSSSCAATCKASSAHRHRASWPAPSAQPASGENELMRKLQQRSKGASWGGISPRSQRPAEVEGKPDNADGKLTIAARRKLLENKLAGCGFQKAAMSGGA